MVIRIKRVYEPAVAEDDRRFLVDRLWPRGMKKETLHLDAWLKAAAPSAALRRWFNHDPAKWPEFRRRYFAELDGHPDVAKTLLDATSQGPVTLLYSASDTVHNNAVALREYLGSSVQRSKHD
ncbi:MAG: DUF488 domain-containing protein [Phycisphaerae bacterium]|nr:DUF488 domain-containing protein [Phycisphaerae bacterium]